MTEKMEPGLEAGTDREAKSRLEGFVGRDYLERGFNDWIPASAEGRIRPKPCGGFAGMTDTRGPSTTYGSGRCGSRNDRWILQESHEAKISNIFA